MMREPEEDDDEGGEREGASFDDDAEEGEALAHFDDDRCHPAEHDDDINEGPIPYYLEDGV